jgi:hypothetical protein
MGWKKVVRVWRLGRVGLSEARRRARTVLLGTETSSWYLHIMEARDDVLKYADPSAWPWESEGSGLLD